MCSICTDGAFEAVASVCALWFFWTSRYIRQTEKKKGSYHVPSPPAGWQAAWLVPPAQEPCLWSGGLCIMEQSISIAHTYRHTHTQKLSPFPRQEVQATCNHEGHRSPLFAIWSEARIVPPSVGVYLCLCSRVSNISTDCRHMQACCLAWVKFQILLRLLSSL